MALDVISRFEVTKEEFMTVPSIESASLNLGSAKAQRGIKYFRKAVISYLSNCALS